MRVAITFDVEHDCPPFEETYRGITEGMPKLLDVLEEKNIKGTFFTTGDVAKRHPSVIEEIVGLGHELACHGHTHVRFDRLDKKSALEEIESSTIVLRNYYPTTSFRAPYLQFPSKYLKLLKELGYRLDSSQAKHKNPFIKMRVEEGILRVPATTTSLVLRAPSKIRNFFLKKFKDPVVLFFHPWEFVDLRKESLRIDCRYNTGEKALEALSKTIDYYKSKNGQFVKTEELQLV